VLEAFGDVCICEPNDSESARLQPCRATVVTEPAPVVELAADLDHEARRKAGEVDDVGSDQCLAAKLVTAELLGAQARPQVPLDPTHRAAEVTGERDS
jgi:hypothetical protein